MKTILAPSLALAMLFAGCTTVGPDYQRPVMPAPDLTDLLRDSEGGAEQGSLTPELLARWWDHLNDPILTELVHGTLAGNLDIRQAQSRVRMSRHVLGGSRSGLYPQIDGSVAYNRRRSSENAIPSMEPNALQQTAGTIATGLGVAQTVSMLRTDPTGALMSIPGQIAGWPAERSADWETDFYHAGFDAAWEVDIFGGTRRGVEAARADLEAMQESLNSIWVSLAGAVAQTYIELRTYQARLRVAESNLRTQEETLELLESLYEAGLRNELAFQQVRYVVESTRASIPSLRCGIETLMNTLAVLTGNMPGDLHKLLAGEQAIPAAAFEVVTGIPANALRQRPDIRMAERQLAAQTARIGVAKAELYPKLILTGSIGLESLKSSTLFDSGGNGWNIGPAVSWPIFHAGAIRKNIRIQTEIQEQYLAAYENTVLSAVKEVRDALAGFAEEQERYQCLEEAEDAARRALEVARDQYKNGLSDFNNVLDAQRSLLLFQDQLAVSKGVISINLIRVYKTLGGGWERLEEA